jgi:hypothetical protein
LGPRKTSALIVSTLVLEGTPRFSPLSMVVCVATLFLPPLNLCMTYLEIGDSGHVPVCAMATHRQRMEFVSFVLRSVTHVTAVDDQPYIDRSCRVRNF